MVSIPLEHFRHAGSGVVHVGVLHTFLSWSEPVLKLLWDVPCSVPCSDLRRSILRHLVKLSRRLMQSELKAMNFKVN